MGTVGSDGTGTKFVAAVNAILDKRHSKVGDIEFDYPSEIDGDGESVTMRFWVHEYEYGVPTKVHAVEATMFVSSFSVRD